MRLNPMLPVLGDQPFNDDKYIFEPKIDGQRLLIRVEKGIAQLSSRYGMDVTKQYPELCRVPIAGGADVVLDGVAAFYDESSGRFSSEALRERMLMRKAIDIRLASVRHPIHYFAFDVLEMNGEDVRGLPLQERKQLLEQVLDDNRSFHRMFSIEGLGKSLFAAIEGEGVEGIIAKRLDSSYEGGRGASWLSVRKYRYANVRIAGYRKRGFGWLLERDGLRIGVIEAGVSASDEQLFQAAAKETVTGEDCGFVYVKPVIEARIRYLHRQRSGEVRNPEFVRFIG